MRPVPLRSCLCVIETARSLFARGTLRIGQAIRGYMSLKADNHFARYVQVGHRGELGPLVSIFPQPRVARPTSQVPSRPLEALPIDPGYVTLNSMG